MVLPIVFLLACAPNNEHIEVSFAKKCLPISANHLSLYPIAAITVQDSATHFVGYDHLSRNKFDIFNLTKNRFDRSIFFETEGPTGIAKIETFGFFGTRLIIKENFRLVLLDSTGNKTFSLRAGSELLTENRFSFDDTSVISSLFDGVAADADGTLFFPVFPKQNDFNFPFAAVDWKNRKIALLGFKSPVAEGIEKYGDKIFPAIDIANDHLAVINYPFSSRIFLYNRKTGEIVEKNLKSRFTPNETPPMASKNINDISARVDYHLNELNFFGVRFDCYRNVYLRVHQGKKEPEAQPVFYLSIISNDFEKLKEIRLNAGLKPYFEVAREGIYFPVNSKHESELCFELLTFEGN